MNDYDEMVSAFGDGTIWDKNISDLKRYIRSVAVTKTGESGNIHHQLNPHRMRVMLAILQTRQIEEERRRNDAINRRTRWTAWASIAVVIVGVVVSIIQLCQSHNTQRFTFTQAPCIVPSSTNTTIPRLADILEEPPDYASYRKVDAYLKSKNLSLSRGSDETDKQAEEIGRKAAELLLAPYIEHMSPEDREKRYPGHPSLQDIKAFYEYTKRTMISVPIKLTPEQE